MLLLPGSLRGMLKLDKFEAETALLGWPSGLAIRPGGRMTHVAVATVGSSLRLWDHSALLGGWR